MGPCLVQFLVLRVRKVALVPELLPPLAHLLLDLLLVDVGGRLHVPLADLVEDVLHLFTILILTVGLSNTGPGSS